MLDWKSYEDVTSFIYETLGAENGVSIVCTGSKCKVTGKSGVKHQVDVLTSFSDGIHEYKTAVECKYWNKKIDKDIVMKVAEIIEDARINKGVIVSKIGFTPDGVEYARYKNIGLIELRELTDEDWKGRIRNIEIDIVAVVPRISIHPIVRETMNLNEPKIDVSLLSIIDAHGKSEELTSYADEVREVIMNTTPGEAIEKEYLFDEDKTLLYAGKEISKVLAGVRVMGQSEVIDQVKSVVNGDDHVWLIMKSIFEEKTYTISKDRQITERGDE